MQRVQKGINIIPATINKAFPKIQILTLDKILNEERPDLPYLGEYMWRKNKPETYFTQSNQHI